MSRAVSPEMAKVVIVGAIDSSGAVTTAAGAGGGPSTTQYSTVTNTLVTSDATTVTVAAGRKAFIQNWDDAAVYVRLGAGAAIGTASFILSAGSAANDGLGGSVMVDDFAGVLSFAAATGAPRVNVAVYS